MPRDVIARYIGAVVAVAIGLGTWTGAGDIVGAQNDPDPARAVLAKARASLGGASRLQAVRGVSMSGTFERVYVGGTLAGTFQQFSLDVTFTLPDVYLRRETRAMGSGTVTYVSGFRRNVLLNEVRTSGADMKFGSSWGPEQIDLERAEFARLVLACLTLETGPLPLQFAYKGTAARPAGDVSVLDVTGPNEFAARLLIDNRTGRPVVLSYRSMVHLPPPRGPASARATADGAMSGPSPAEMREIELRLSDHKAVDGVYFPQRIVKSAAGTMLERTVITKLVVNPTERPSVRR